MDLYKYMTAVLILFALVPTVYYFFLFRRIFKTAGLDYKRPVFLCLEILLCLIVWHFMSDVTTWPAIFLYLIPLVDLLVLLADFILKKISGKTNDEAGRKVWKKILGFGLIPLAVMIAYFIIGYANMRNIVRTDYVVTTDKEIPAEGFRVCFISDVHCGNAMDEADYERISREIESCQPDILILGGDLVDFKSEKDMADAMFKSFGSIKTSAGIYYIFGNHDRIADYKDSVFSEEYIIDQCEENSITVLQDECVRFENGITLVGREDADTKYDRIRKEAEEVFAEVDTSDFILVADHQPTEYALLARLGMDLAMAGHLHAGQLFPSSIILGLTNDEHVTYGRYRITQKGNKRMKDAGPAKDGEGTASAVVSSGLAGWAYPLRTAGISEYCIIDIEKEK